MIKSASDMRKPYTGHMRSLVIALDVGTTFSGVSYAILEPGEIPKIHGVTRFPGQEHVAGNSKIPSVLYYDRDGNVMCAGAEADNASVTSQAEDEYWIKTELFKLRLRPKSMKLSMNGMRLSPLPRNKSPVLVFGDFLRYLFVCTRSFIIDTHANGKALWEAVEKSIEFVLSHPNGWEGAQQTKMRRAAVYGGLISDTDEGRARIRFVTEGEASLHACVQSGLAADVLSNPSRHGFLVADAGGGTLDISSYVVRGTNPLVIEEVAPPDCIFAGSVFVSRRAREFLAEKLKSSKYGSSDSVDHITKRFDETTKRLFRDKNDIQWVPFGSPLDKDVNVGIRGGSLKLTGGEVAELFEPSIQAAITSIKAQVVASQGMIKSVWLVGGFAASPWLFTQLQERLASMKITVSRPDNQTSKAVADGALGFYCDHHVSARVSRFMYGVEYLREFDPYDSEHVARKERLCELPSGPQLLPDAFDCILARGVKVKESTVFTRKYCTELTNLSTLSVFEVEIWCYRGGDSIPPWILRHHEDYSTLCVVRADLSPLNGTAEPKSGRNGKTYWTIVFSVEIHFGLTEFRARIKWNDNGIIKYGPASIVYSESGHRADEDETDAYSEDDFGSRAASRAPSRPASVAPSRTHSQDSVGSGAKTPQGGRLDATFMDAVSRSRSVSTSQSTHSRSQSYHQSQLQASQASFAQPQPQPQPQAPPPPAQPQPQPHAQQYQQSIYTERSREYEHERTVSSSVSRVSSSVAHVERDRKASAASRLSNAYAAQSRTDSEKERRTREERERVATVAVAERDRLDRERAVMERDRFERERVVAERERLERERVERERDKAERIEKERTKVERERAERERERAERERERMERERERVERERERLQAERERIEREQAEQERIEREKAAAATTQKGKGKKNKNASKLSSPIDLADTVVGKSPGQLGQALTSVWGSQSNAATPAASPFPTSARSVEPTTPRSGLPIPRELEPTTPAVEAPSAFFMTPLADASREPPGGLSLEFHPPPEIVYPEDAPAAGHTPADTVPPEQLIAETHAQAMVAATESEFVETSEHVETSATQESFEQVQVGETGTGAGGSVFGFETSETAATELQETSQTQAFGWGGWGTTSATEAISNTTKGLPSLGFGGGGLSSTFGRMSSFFGSEEQKDIELSQVQTTETVGEEQAGVPGLEFGAPPLADSTLESPAMLVPPPGGGDGGWTEVAGATETTALPGDDPASAVEPSTTEAPTDAQAEEGEGDDGFFTSKKKKGTPANRKKKKK